MTPGGPEAKHSRGHASHEEAFHVHADPALVRKPTRLRTGIGKVHQKISTKSPEAQAFYDQGLASLHSYRWIEAARSFHTALSFDESLPMAHLGLARAYEGLKDDEAADRELALAQSKAANVTPRERAYLQAHALKRSALRAGATDRDRALKSYRDALDDLIEEDPSDAEAWLLRGNAEEGPWGKGQSGRESSLPFYQGALKARANHFGAHHYLAHSYENIGQPHRALHHAAIFAQACPKVAHARHMYAHTLPRLGRWDEAIAELEAASMLEKEREREEGIAPRHDWHRVHNLNLLGLAYLQTGRFEEAEKVLRESFATPIPDPLVQSWHAVWPEFLLSRERPQDARSAARELAARPSAMARVIGTALEGEALLDAGNRSGAREKSEQARSLVEELRLLSADHPRGDALVWVATDYANVLDARISLHDAPDPQWTDYVRRLGASIAANPTFDGWGVSYLRLRRLERDARTRDHRELARELQAHIDQLPGVPDAK